MRSRVPLFALLVVASSLALPLIAHAGGIPFFGPIVPTGVNRCAAGWGAVVEVINNIISFLITIAIVFVAPLMIAWAGFLFVVNPVNASGKEQAKKILLNTVVGIVIALAGWMIVDAIMVVLYNPNAQSGTTRLTAWSQLITSGGEPYCLIAEGSLYKLNQVKVTGSTAEGGLTTTPGPGQLKNGFAIGCSTSNDQNATTLVDAGVSGHSTNNCCTKTQSTCTSLDGMLQDTIQQIINVKNRCGGIIVTGGTEVGHASEGGTGSHSSGAKVDIGQNLIDCISKTSGKKLISTSKVEDSCGNIYTWETNPNHTDIYVKNACFLR